MVKQPWRFVWSVVREGFVFSMIVLVTMAVAAQGLEAASTLALRYLVNSLSGLRNQNPILGALLFPATAYLGAIAGASVINAAFQRLDITVRGEFVARVEKQLFSHLLYHSPQYFSDKLAGRLAQQIRTASQNASNLVNLVTYYGFRLTTLLCIASVILGQYSLSYIALFLGWTSAFLVGTYYLSKACVRWSDALAKSVALTTGRYVDAVNNVEAIRSFGRFDSETSYASTFIDNEKENKIELRTRFFYLFVFQIVAKLILLGLVLLLSIKPFLGGKPNVGIFVMTITLGGMIASVVQEISNRVYELFDNYASLKQALNLLCEPHGIADDRSAPDIVINGGSICFQHVSFSYTEGSFALKDINLSIKAGEKVGIVGPSGAGKSTLIKLLRRDYLPTVGRILVNDQDIISITQLSLSDAIGEVPQVPRLFNRSIRENIAFGRPTASEQEIHEAAQRAHCSEFFRTKEKGLDALIGEAGSNLSGGERQRISLARAFLKGAPILILDEATAALDPESEELIQESLKNLMIGKTVIAISHRLSTITQMDRILVLVGGTVVEEGSHSELILLGAQYARMWTVQGAAYKIAVAGNGGTSMTDVNADASGTTSNPRHDPYRR